MWLRLNKDTKAGTKYSIIWVDSDKDSEKLIKKGEVTRCTGPDGVAFGESAPEDITKAIKKEKNKKDKDITN